MSEMEKSGMSRRDFIKSAALAGVMRGVSPVIGGCAAKLASGNTLSGKNTEKNGGLPHRTLGKGNAALEVSALGFGCTIIAAGIPIRKWRSGWCMRRSTAV